MCDPSLAQVECYSGHTYAGEPRALVWQGRRYRVARVEDRWRTPEGPGFRVRTEGGLSFDLYYHEPDDRWSIRPWPNAAESSGAVAKLDTQPGAEGQVIDPR